MEVPGILKKTTIRTKRTLMIYISAFFFMFAFTILAFSIATFMINRFPENDNAILFVGVIMGSVSFFGIFVDSLWSYLQKIHPPKKLTLWALRGVMCTVLIFFLSGLGQLGEIFNIFRWTLFTFIAAFTYGWSYDLYDVTITTTILNRSKKENLAQNISQKKVFEVLGMISGLVLAGLLMWIGPNFTLFALLIILIFVHLFFSLHFDEEADEGEKLEFSEHALADWKAVFNSIHDHDKIRETTSHLPDQLKNGVTGLAQKTTVALRNLPASAMYLSGEILEKARLELLDILAKEGEIVYKGDHKEKFNYRVMFSEVVNTFGNFFAIFGKDFHAPLFWSACVVMIFSFWDTMAITYQPLLLGEFAEDKPTIAAISGLIIILFIFPVFVLQIPFAIMADKIGRHIMMIMGLLLSGIGVIFVSTTDSIAILIIMGMLGGAGYAAAFSPAEAMFVSEFKKARARYESETNSSQKGAAAIRVALNMGNIFGQLIGGLLFALMGFRGGFLFFGFFFLTVAIISIVFYFKIRPREVLLPVASSNNAVIDSSDINMNTVSSNQLDNNVPSNQPINNLAKNVGMNENLSTENSSLQNNSFNQQINQTPISSNDHLSP